MNEKRKIEWAAQEYRHTVKRPDWFWALGIISLAFAVGSLILGNILFAFFILLGAFTVAMYAAREPQTVQFRISPEGIRIKNTLYPFAHLKAFSIYADLHGDHHLALKSEKALMPYITLPLGETEQDMIRSVLADYLTEESYNEPLIERFASRLGF
jgi:hypothetical protein